MSAPIFARVAMGHDHWVWGDLHSLTYKSRTYTAEEVAARLDGLVTDAMVEAGIQGFIAEGNRIDGRLEGPTEDWFKLARPMLRAALTAALEAAKETER